MLLIKRKVQRSVMLKQRKIVMGNLDTDFATFMINFFHSEENHGIKFLFHLLIRTNGYILSEYSFSPLGSSQSMGKIIVTSWNRHNRIPQKKAEDSWRERKEWAESFSLCLFFKATSLRSRLWVGCIVWTQNSILDPVTSSLRYSEEEIEYDIFG